MREGSCIPGIVQQPRYILVRDGSLPFGFWLCPLGSPMRTSSTSYSITGLPERRAPHPFFSPHPFPGGSDANHQVGLVVAGIQCDRRFRNDVAADRHDVRSVRDSGVRRGRDHPEPERKGVHPLLVHARLPGTGVLSVLGESAGRSRKARIPARVVTLTAQFPARGTKTPRKVVDTDDVLGLS